MEKQLMVGKWWAHAGVKGRGDTSRVVIMIPLGAKAFAESCLEGLGKGEKIIERKKEEPK